MPTVEFIDIFSRAKAKVAAGEELLPALGRAVDDYVLSWPRWHAWDFAPNPERLPALPTPSTPWPYREFWSHPWNGAVRGARSSILQTAIMAIDTVIQDKVKRRPSGREMLFYGGLRQFPMMPTGVTSDGRRFLRFHTDATLGIPQDAALAALERALDILRNEEQPPYEKPTPQQPAPTPTPTPKPPPMPDPTREYKIFDGQGGLVDLRDWAGTVGDNKVIAIVHNASQIRYWQSIQQIGTRIQLWRRADGRYQMVETHASGQTTVFDGEPEIAFAGSTKFVPVSTWLMPEPPNKTEWVWPLIETIPPTFPPNPWGFVSTEGLTMAEYDRIKQLITDLASIKPEDVQSAKTGLEIINMQAQLFEREHAPTIIERNNRVVSVLSALLPQS